MDEAKLKAIIIDDEPSALRILRNFSAKSNQIEVVKTFRSALQVQAYLLQQPVDVMFLDINMPELTGLELLKIISNPPLVVLTTAYSEYAVESYNFSVADYLLKPIAFSRFIKAVYKCQDLLSDKTTSDRNDKTLHLKDGSKLYQISKNDITHLEAYGNYLKVFTVNQRIVLKSSLKAFLEEHFYPDLIRVHKSYAVNKSRINSVSYSKIKLQNIEIPVGRKYREDFISNFL